MLVIFHRNEILLHGTFYKVFHITFNADRQIIASALYFHNRKVFGLFDIENSFFFQIPEEIAFRDGADKLSRSV